MACYTDGMMEKNKRLQVVLTPEEWSAVKYLAKDTHLSWSSLVRFALAELARARAKEQAKDA